MNNLPSRAPSTQSHDIPKGEVLAEFMSQGWADSSLEGVSAAEVVKFAAARRAKLSALYPEVRIVIPAGTFKARSNDTDYKFRVLTDFAYLTGISASDSVPDSVLVLEPMPDGHQALLFIHPRSPRDTDEFHSDRRHGEFWVGRRLSTDEAQKRYGISVRHIDSLPELLSDEVETLAIRGEDPIIDSLVEKHKKRETIAASGSHACVLHWIKNDGDVLPGDLILIDAGAEVESMYTADITRTIPINGKFSPAQRKIYQLVYEAQQAGIAAVKPGAPWIAFHEAASAVLARGLEELGVLPGTAEESLDPDAGFHRRWTIHSTGHMLGLDVHDCAAARAESYRKGLLEEGMVLTVEPGLYIQPDDLLFPAEYRGIGVRIEDDVLVTSSGARVLSGALPRHPDEVEVWVSNALNLNN